MAKFRSKFLTYVKINNSYKVIVKPTFNSTLATSAKLDSSQKVKESTSGWGQSFRRGMKKTSTQMPTLFPFILKQYTYYT